MNQLSIPNEVTAQEVQREKSLGGAIDLCVKAAGYEPKEVQAALKLDKAQFSRWTAGSEGVIWPRLIQVMDFCGNDAPLLWMLHDRHYDLASLRHTESMLERKNRLLEEEVAALRRVLKAAA